MITKHLQAIEELRAMGYAVTIIAPDDLGVTSREQAEEWMEDVINTCLEITEEENGGGRYADSTKTEA